MSANKSTSSYWKKRLVKLPTKAGDDTETATFYIRAQFGGKREYLPVGTLDQTIGAERAKEVYLLFLAGKIEEAKTKYAVRKHVEKKVLVTVSDYLEIVKARGDILEITYTGYVHSLKLIVSEILKLPKTNGRFSYKDGKHNAWQQKILDTPLADITRDKVLGWRSARIKAAAGNPVKVLSATRTANSNIRCARSLFSAKLLEKLNVVGLPDPLPFHKIKLDGNGSCKYKSQVNPRTLLNEAQDELREAKPEVYKVIILALIFGLRRGEIDLLERTSLDIKRLRIVIQGTEYFHPKNKSSEDELDMEEEVAEELKALMDSGNSRFFVESDQPPKALGAHRYYRCQAVFDKALAWLRGKGIKGNKPLHTLRKEVGAEIASEKGIYAAQGYLRHAQISTTEAIYADQKKRITPGFGNVFKKQLPKAA
jgi:integrase